MSISADLLTYLKSQSTITAIVGSGTSARIYPDFIKEGMSRPCIQYRKISGGEITGISGGHGLHKATFEITAIAANRASADALDDALYDVLQGGNRTMGSTVVTEVVVNQDGRDAGADPAAAGSDQHDYWSRTNYELWYSE